MQIPLNEFEEYISETILARGLSYFNNGYVCAPDLLRPGGYEFVVEGSEDYTVQINLNHGTINEFDCDCPYDKGPVCKHVVAVIYYLQEYEAELNEVFTESNNTAKQKNTVQQVNDLLEKASHDDLKQFIRDKTQEDSTFRNMFLSSFAHLNTDESKALYANQVKSILKTASDRDGFIDWSEARQVGIAVDRLLDTAHRHVEAKNYQSALFISTAVMEQMVDALEYTDDDGDIGSSIEAGFNILYRVAQENHDEQLRKEILEYCFSAFDKDLYWGWDWHLGVLRIAAFLIKTEEETQRIFELIDRKQHSEFEKEEVQSIKYEILLKMRGEAEANNYLEEHITNPNLRREAIQKALNRKDFDKANKLAKDGVEYDMGDKPGLVKEWYDWLLKIAQKQGNSEKIIEYARYLLIDNFSNQQDYYQILKDNVKPENWKEFIEKVIEDISTQKPWPDTDLIADIFIREKRWDRLMDMVKKDPDLRTIERYEKYLSENYAGDIVDMYATEIMKYMENNTGRKHYQVVCRYLRRMKKIGGSDKANKTISMLREKYPRRRALMEELNNV